MLPTRGNAAHAMPRSLAAGDYTLLMAIESASRAQAFYRVCRSRADGQLSCDCPAWMFNAQRCCKHTQAVALLTRPMPVPTPRDAPDGTLDHSLITAIREQWPGLTGAWSMEEHAARLGSDPYHVVLISLQTPNGDLASGAVAFAERHSPRLQRTAPVAAWAGYAIAAELCRRANLPLAGAPPQHFLLPHRTARRSGTAQQADLALADILRIGEEIQLGDGLTPQIRAENTLRLFLGPLFVALEEQGFLDVSSRLTPQRTYRLRRDPAKRRERRVRVFDDGRYVQDYCIVRAQECPADDHFLTVFLGLLSDERGTLAVVKRHNVFPPNSDGPEREVIPAIWQPVVTA